MNGTTSAAMKDIRTASCPCPSAPSTRFLLTGQSSMAYPQSSSHSDVINWRPDLDHPPPAHTHHHHHDYAWHAPALTDSYPVAFDQPQHAYSLAGTTSHFHQPTNYDAALVSGSAFHPLPVSRPSSASSNSSSTLYTHHTAWDSSLYHFDHDAADNDPRPHTANPPATVSLSDSPPAPSPSPRVKQEEIPADIFVFEGPPTVYVGHSSSSLEDRPFPTAPAYAPLTEMPLRATHACKAQLRMMGLYRLDIFAVQANTKEKDDNTDWLGQPIGPLPVEGQELSFQLGDIDAVKPDPEHLPHAPDGLSPSPAPSLEYAAEEDDEGEDTWDSSPPSVLFSPVASEHASYEPMIMTPAQSLGFMRGADDDSYTSSPPSSLRSAQSYPYLSSPPRQFRAPYQKGTYNRSPLPYSSILFPGASSRHTSDSRIQDDIYHGDLKDHHIGKSSALSTALYTPSKQDVSGDSLSSNAAWAPHLNSLANATRQRMAPPHFSVPMGSYGSYPQGERVRYVG
ncbi:hypothetical protein BDW22DRAFT_1481455 [Trametopsis cervina]|nr:hypothetical protein BDW22DRAFT_1481455 [Trametopsis cervina]